MIVQETGISDNVETGRGVLTFSNLEEAYDCIENVREDFALHSRSAREIVDRYFDYRIVLPKMLEIALG